MPARDFKELLLYSGGLRAHYKVTDRHTHRGRERERREWGNWAKMDLWTYSAESRATTVKVILLSNPTLTTAASLVSNLLFGL